MRTTLLLILGMLACDQQESYMTVHEYCRQWANSHYTETSDSEKVELTRTLIKNDLFLQCVREKGFQ